MNFSVVEWNPVELFKLFTVFDVSLGVILEPYIMGYNGQI
jgi:hypothetical protein